MRFFNHLCDNCGVFLEPTDPALCNACTFLNTHPYENNQVGCRGETAGLVNRRWQMRFNRGELPFRYRELEESGSGLEGGYTRRRQTTQSPG